MLSAENRNIDMTKGKIFPLFMRFFIPLILTNLLQTTYNVADSIIVGFSNQPDALGAVGTTTGFINFMINIFIGCSIGTKVLVAGKIGAENYDDAKKFASVSIALSILLGAICAVMGCFLSKPILSSMGNKGSLLDLAVIYTCIYFIGTPFMALTNFSIAILHAEGDTKTPLYILSATGLLNVVLNCVFVFTFNMSVEGVALSSAISNVISALMLVYKVMHSFSIKTRDIKLSLSDSLSILKIGLPCGIQSALFSVSHMMIQSSIVTVNNIYTPSNAGYTPIVKGCAACTNIESFSTITSSSLGQATVSFISQNYGARNFERIKKIRIFGYTFAFIILSVLAMSLIALSKPLLSLFNIFEDGDALDRLAYNSAIIRMKYMFIPYFLLGFMDVGAGILQGLKKSGTAAIVSLSGSCLIRIIWILTVFKANPTLETLFIIFPISWFITAFIHFILANKALKNADCNDIHSRCSSDVSGHL